jgi:hypothetical protein
MMRLERQRGRLRKAFCMALPLGVLAVLAGCSAAPRGRTAPAAPPAAAAAVDDSVYDWHGLLIAPFGSSLKNIPGGLHEVLLFRDDAHGGASEDAECYSPDGTPPPFIGRVPDEYLLCFKHDRLSRIQASVHLPAQEAPATFGAACAAWLRHAAQAGGPGNAGGCDGRDGGIRWSGRLADESSLSVTLDGPSEP